VGGVHRGAVLLRSQAPSRMTARGTHDNNDTGVPLKADTAQKAPTAEPLGLKLGNLI
jgi:hypothetical protein